MSPVNYDTILEKVTQSRTGQQPPALLLAVSKMQPVEKIQWLYEKGQIDFGENYVQEALKKIDHFRTATPKIQWHLIGHLQKNKVKSVVGLFELIHSVDSVELAEKINLEMGKKNPGHKQKILLQINQGAEDSKTGFTEDSLELNWPRIKKMESIEVHGLMSLPPLHENPEQTRPYFKKLKKDLQRLQNDRGQHPLNQLSMGTSQDFLIAIEEGATIVRVGTLLFGERS